MAPVEKPSEELGSRVLLEASGVRVWDDRVPAGETQPLHIHRRPYLAVIIAGERAETVGEDGSVQRVFQDLAPGETHYFGSEQLPLVHALRNTGATEVSVIIIELLD
jgi:beta-alanine degradation protein BauB